METCSPGAVPLPHVEVLPPITLGAAAEANHRIANSLQLLSAMTSIEARGLTDERARAVIGRVQQRIGAVADLHRQLCRTPASAALDLAAYLRALCASLEQSAGRHLTLDVGSVTVDAGHATAIGMIVSELVSNALKYAYPPDAPGPVRVMLRALPFRGYLIEVADRGCGLPGGSPRADGLGSQLVRLLARRIGGELRYLDATPGTRCLLSVSDL